MKKYFFITLIAFFTIPALAGKCPVYQHNSEEHVAYLEDLPDCSVSQYNSKSMVGCSVRGFIINVASRSTELSNADLLTFFRGRDLRGFDFRRADLRGVNFRGSNLRNVDFTNATIMNADFRDANLRRADFRGTQAVQAKFQGADARNADFSIANLSEAEFNNANLTRAKFNGSEIGSADFGGSNLTRAQFKYQLNPGNTNSGWAQGNNVSFSGALLNQTDMSGFWGCYGSQSAAVSAWTSRGRDGMTLPTRGIQ